MTDTAKGVLGLAIAMAAMLTIASYAFAQPRNCTDTKHAMRHHAHKDDLLLKVEKRKGVVIRWWVARRNDERFITISRDGQTCLYRATGEA